MRIVHRVYRSMIRVWVANSMRKNMYILLDQNTCIVSKAKIYYNKMNIIK
jgi:hypothetical protein